MINIHNLIDPFVGLSSIFLSICLILFPPRYRHQFYGITTQQTITDERSWKTGQKRFALALFLIGVLFLIIGSTSLRDSLPNYVKFFLLLLLWRISKWLIDQSLTKTQQSDS